MSLKITFLETILYTYLLKWKQYLQQKELEYCRPILNK